MSLHYLDNSATTPVSAPVAQKALDLMTSRFGNPSSLHTLGFDAEQEMQNARKTIAGFLSVDPETITFTSGGTEANNLALLGAAESQKRRGKHILTTQIEHPSVLNTCKQLEKLGFSVQYLAPTKGGTISPDDVLEAIQEDTILISIMMVNNETGALFPWDTVASKIKKQYPQILLHSDMVQAFGKMPISLSKIPLDLLSCSGHKIGAPKGVGALYCKKGVTLRPPFAFGGGQEKGLRSGTENVPAIAAFGMAVSTLPSFAEQESRYQALQKQLLEDLKSFENVSLHLPGSHVPYISHFSLCGVKSETLVHFLASQNVFVSGGSACAKGKQSHVLTAMNLPKREIDASLRVSFSPHNTKEDIKALIEALEKADKTLVHT
ncbi:MAG: cysteine desulfurase [Clostridia bacterium]|nr:cysteine desulfurase [Clostridia bacterium]